jgi:hypothetical protein
MGNEGQKLIEITEPLYGAFMNSSMLEASTIRVRGRAVPSRKVHVNGIEAERHGQWFEAQVVLAAGRNKISAVCDAHYDTIEVSCASGEEPRYSVSIDDAIFFLHDIWRNGYDSIFENFLLKGLHDLHGQYETKFTLNIFRKIDERYKHQFGNFSIDHFPAKYLGEWEANSNWLRLAFHADSEFPNKPYSEIHGGRNLMVDLEDIEREMKRFAGGAHAPASIIHWCLAPSGSFTMLAERGVEVLCGYFSIDKKPIDDHERFITNYDIDYKRSKYISEIGALMDRESRIVLCDCAIVFNRTELPQIQCEIEKWLMSPERVKAMVLCTHEQYFWPNWEALASWYKEDETESDSYRYVPDHLQRMRKGIEIVSEYGYKPVFLHECFRY